MIFHPMGNILILTIFADTIIKTHEKYGEF